MGYVSSLEGIYIVADGILPVFYGTKIPKKTPDFAAAVPEFFIASLRILQYYTKASISKPFIYIYTLFIYLVSMYGDVYNMNLHVFCYYIYIYIYIYIRYVYYQICFKACKTTIHIISALRSVVLGARCWISKCWAWRERRKQKARLVPGRCSI